MRTCVVVAASFRQMSIIEKQQKRFSFSLTQRQVVINGVRPRPQFHLHFFSGEFVCHNIRCYHLHSHETMCVFLLFFCQAREIMYLIIGWTIVTSLWRGDCDATIGSIHSGLGDLSCYGFFCLSLSLPLSFFFVFGLVYFNPWEKRHAH